MGNKNSWTGIDDNKFHEYETKMLVHSGLPIEAFNVSNVVIDDQGNYIRTIIVGDPLN